ncbi:hypothetical protein HG535_0D05010 [Zygotorulaspora mrakii]|uniref:Kynurenine formamidase n=1 Tax=Zygotorulaspora mrakii TaxID=42260 RepID=A0A7H9B4V7_ZYGMR|nr:uncharacterized protein HG535_0D05010 [Zygotorulaspora mrakii]QLG72792.1 hypothetical protein HG535_0D05010 [Zygotorulaspora mrakii]
MTKNIDRLYDRSVSFYEPVKNRSPNAIVFIHGGAWIDEKNTPNDFEFLCGAMLNMSDNDLDYAMYGITYRLSPTVKHPTHICDVIENLYRLIKDKGIKKLQLVGHSVGATLAWQVATATATNELCSSSEKLIYVQSCLTGLYLIDGIFSISELLDEYPEYIYFVSQAFQNNGKEFEELSYSIKRLPCWISYIHLLHSYKDELLTLRQPRYMADLLQENAIPYISYFSDMGLHNEVYENPKLARYLLDNLKFT